MFGSLGATWLPLALIFLATWVTGEVMSSLPPPGRGDGHQPTGTPR